LESIHGIKSHWLSNAPTLRSVKDHIEEICGKNKLSDPNSLSFEDSIHKGSLSETSQYEPINN
jgi:hypothetical protein